MPNMHSKKGRRGGRVLQRMQKHATGTWVGAMLHCKYTCITYNIYVWCGKSHSTNKQQSIEECGSSTMVHYWFFFNYYWRSIYIRTNFARVHNTNAQIDGNIYCTYILHELLRLLDLYTYTFTHISLLLPTAASLQSYASYRPEPEPDACNPTYTWELSYFRAHFHGTQLAIVVILELNIKLCTLAVHPEYDCSSFRECI